MEFKNPLLIVVRVGDDPIEFATDRELYDWTENQATQWDSVSVSLSEVAELLSNAQNFLSEHVNRWRGHAGAISAEISNYDGDNLENQLRNISVQMQTYIAAGQLLWAGDDASQRVFSLADDDEESCLWLLLSLLGKMRWYLIENNDARYWLAYTRASLKFADSNASASFFRKQRASISEVEKIVSGLAEKHQLAVDEGERQKAVFEIMQGDVSARFDGLSVSLSKDAEGQRSDFDDEWTKLRTTYDRDLKLRAPREYWGVKFGEHEKSSKDWRNAFFLAATVAISALSLSVWLLVSGRVQVPASLGSYGWVVPASMLGIPAFLSLWILRLFGRQWSDHLLRREDARERVVMIETFLAISRDTDSPGAISDPAQLGIVLSSIFRSGPGMTTDDSPPAGFFEVLMTRAAGSQGKQVP